MITSLTRVGESITFSAATVIAALLSLLVATFQIYSTLGVPLAIGIGVMLLAGLTLLPALLAVFGRAAFWPSKTRGGTGKIGVWGRVAGRITQHPAIDPDHRAGRLRRPGRGLAGLQGRGLRRRDQRARAQRFGGRAGAADQVLPEQHSQPDEHHLQAEAARLGRTRPCWPRPSRSCPAAGCSPRSPDRSNPTGYALTPAQYAALHRLLGPAKALPPVPPASLKIPAGGIPAVPGHRAVREPGRAHRAVRHRAEGRRRGQHVGPGRGAVDPGRDHPGAARHRRGRLGGRRRGARPVRREQHLGQRPVPGHPGRDPGHRPAAGPGHAEPGRPAIPDRLGRPVLPGRAGPGRAAVHRHRRVGRADLHPAVPDVHLPARPGRGLQHPGDDPDPGGSAGSCRCARRCTAR